MYVSGQFANFVSRIHTAQTMSDLNNYVIEGSGYVAAYAADRDTYYNLFNKWATEYNKRYFFASTGQSLPKNQWPFIN